MSPRPIRLTLLAFALAMTVTGCQQTQASPQAPASDTAKQPGKQDAGKYKDLLARMQAVDAEPDAVRRCLDYPAPPGVKWTAEVIRARCDLLAPAPTFINDGAAAKAPAEAAAIFDAGFAALMKEAQASPAARDGRINRAVGVFSDGAALPPTRTAGYSTAHEVHSPTRHGARACWRRRAAPAGVRMRARPNPPTWIQRRNKRRRPPTTCARLTSLSPACPQHAHCARPR